MSNTIKKFETKIIGFETKIIEIEKPRDDISKALGEAIASNSPMVKLSIELPVSLVVQVIHAPTVKVLRIRPNRTSTQVLNREDVEHILHMRFIEKKSGGEIARLYKQVSRANIYAILSGRTWRDVFKEFMTQLKK